MRANKNIILYPRYYTKGIFSFISLLSIWLYSYQITAQTIPIAIKSNLTTYEDDRLKIVLQSCSRKLQDLICQALLLSKNSDRQVELNGNNIKLVDFEGNEYYASSLKLANRTSENNLIRTELVESVPFKASFIFTKIPSTVAKIALLQIPLAGGVSTTVKFRNLIAIDPNAPKESETPIITKSTPIATEVSNNNNLICPEPTKILYRAASKHYLLYICGAKSPTHYVGIAKDGSQGITLRLRYYDRSRFSADNGETNYTIAADRLTIRKDNKVIYQEKIEVLQSLPGTTAAENPTPKPNPQKNSTTTANTSPKRTSNPQSTPKIKRRTTHPQ